MRGLGQWTRAVTRKVTNRHARPKAQRKKPSRGKSLLSKKELASSSGESAAVHHAQTSPLGFSDETGKGDNDPAVGRTVETLSVAGSDAPVSKQEKEARSVGEISS